MSGYWMSACGPAPLLNSTIWTLQEDAAETRHQPSAKAGAAKELS